MCTCVSVFGSVGGWVGVLRLWHVLLERSANPCHATLVSLQYVPYVQFMVVLVLVPLQQFLDDMLGDSDPEDVLGSATEGPWEAEYFQLLEELGPAAPLSGAVWAAAERAEASAGRAAEAFHPSEAAAPPLDLAPALAAAAAAAAERMRLVRLPQLCARLPHLHTLSLRDMVVSANDFAAAATSCPRLARLDYLVRSCTKDHAHTMMHFWGASPYF